MLKLGVIPMVVGGFVSIHPLCAATEPDGTHRVVIRAEARSDEAAAKGNAGSGDERAERNRVVEILRARIANEDERNAPSRLTVAFGSAEAEPAVMIGIHLEDPDAALCSHLSLEPGAATLVSFVSPGLPAATGGIELFDVIVAVDDVRPMPPDRLRALLAEGVPGEAMAIEVLRKGQTRTVHVTPEAFDRQRLQAGSARAFVDLGRSPGSQMLRVPGAVHDSIFRSSAGAPLVFDDALQSFYWTDRRGTARSSDPEQEAERVKRLEADMQRIEKAIEASIEQVLARVLESVEEMLQRFADTLTEPGGD